MSERENWDSEKMKQIVRDKRTKMGLQFTRQLIKSEQEAFLNEDKIPVGALSPRTFKQWKEMESMPPSSTCLLCGKDISNAQGVIVNLNGTFYTVCKEDFDKVRGNSGEECGEESTSPTNPPTHTTTTPAATPAAPTATAGDPVATALQMLQSALSAPKPAPIDEEKVIASAVAQAQKAVKDEFSKTVGEFLKNNIVSSSSEDKGNTSTPTLPSAKGDGVEETSKATRWAAKASSDATDAVKKLMKFLSEFSYFRDGVSMRLINTFARLKDKKDALESYCRVTQMEDLADMIEKMKSPEFKEVCDAFGKLKTPKPVNNRFAVFYGTPGGGKTYAAIQAGKNINGNDCEVMICHRGMDAADMLYAYHLDYDTQKRGYVPTALLKAMLSGRCVVLDEINLLPMESRMFLQNILDNKDKVSVMGTEIPIHKGFFIIGTMNIETGDGIQPLPVPLADRACVITEFKTTAAQAAVGAGLC